MITLLLKVPHTVCLAFSGGVDSLSVAHFLKQGKKKLTLLHFNHGCEYSDGIEAQCRDRAATLGLPIVVGYNEIPVPPKGRSLEDHWRRQRYNFLRTQNQDQKIVLCHHLDDCAETWVWSSLHGQSKLIPVENNNVIRPFLITDKSEFVKYAERYNLIPVDDPYNYDYKLTRNYIRANIMDHAYKINPGLKTVIRKKYLELVK